MFGRFALSLAIFVSALPCLAQALPDRPEKLKYPALSFKVPRAQDFKTTLKNGIPVYVSSDATVSPIVSLTVNWRGGGFMEPNGKEGLAQIYGSQLSQGGSKKMDATKQEDRLEDLAATITSKCDDTDGSITMRCMAKDFNEVYGMLFDSLTQPAFAQDRLDLAKRTSKQAVERRNDSVTTIAPYIMGHLLFGEEHFSAKLPTTASIDSITRDDLVALHSNILHPSNFVVAVSGRFDKKNLLDRLNSTLGSIKPNRMALVPQVPAPDYTRQPGIYVVDKAAPQAMVVFAFPGMRRSDADWHAAAVMNHILGGSFTGRLMKKIRSDEGLTYGIRTNLGEGPYWTGDVVGSAQTNNNTVAYLLRLAIAEMETLKNVPLTEAELQTIKDGLIESFPSQWGKQAAVGTFAQEAILGWPEDWWTDYRDKIQAVTADDVQRMARRLLDMDKIVVLTVGQADTMEAGDHDRPVLLKDTLPLPMKRLPLRDPNTGKPM